MKNLFVLDHYYAIDHKDFCIIIESEKSINEIIKICGSVTFLLEDLFDTSVSLDMNCLLDVLVTYYGAEDKKDEVITQNITYKDVLSLLDLPIDGLYEEYKIPDFYDNGIYVVDLYEARESCCGKNYREIMNSHLPKGEQLQQLISLLQEKGVEE